MAFGTQMRTLVSPCPVCNTHLYGQHDLLGLFWPWCKQMCVTGIWKAVSKDRVPPWISVLGRCRTPMQMQCSINHQQLHGSMDYSQVRENVLNRAHTWVSLLTFLLLCCDISLIDNLCAKKTCRADMGSVRRTYNSSAEEADNDAAWSKMKTNAWRRSNKKHQFRRSQIWLAVADAVRPDLGSQTSLWRALDSH